MKNLLAILFTILWIVLPAQDKPVFKPQVKLDEVTEVVSAEGVNTFLVINGGNYTVVDQSSKLQLGTMQVDIGSLGVPGHGIAYLLSNTGFVISTGKGLLHADIITGKVDTLFGECAFPEMVVNYIPAPWNKNLLIIAAKTYPIDKNETIHFVNDAGNTTVYDDSKSCRLILYNTQLKKTERSVPVDYEVTAFAPGKNKTTLLAGTFDGEVVEIDSLFNTRKLFAPTKNPVYIVLNSGSNIVAVAHPYPKNIDYRGQNRVYVYTTHTGTIRSIELPQQVPPAANKYSMETATAQVKRVFPLPDTNRVLVNFAYNYLVELNLTNLDTIHYAVNQPVADFYCYNRDSTQLLSAYQQTASIFGVRGTLAMYDLQSRKLLPPFNRAAAQCNFKNIYKLRDRNGNYHIVGYTYESLFGPDTLVVFSSYKTEPTFLVARGARLILNEEDTTLTITSSGSLFATGHLALENLEHSIYRFNLAGWNVEDTLHPEIFEVSYHAGKTHQPSWPYNITNVRTLYNGKFLIEGYSYDKKKTLFTVLLIDTAGQTLITTPPFDQNAGSELQVSADKKYFTYTTYVAKSEKAVVWSIAEQKIVFTTAHQNIPHTSFDKTLSVFWYIGRSNDGNSKVYKVSLNSSATTEEVIFTNPDFLSLQTDMANNLMATENYDRIALAQLSTGKVLWQTNLLESFIHITHQPNGFAFVTGSEHHLINYNLNHLYFTCYEGYKPVEILNNLLYRSDKSTINNLGFALNGRCYAPSDFDLYFNRPDSVIAASGSCNLRVNTLMQRVIEKRKSYMGVANFNMALNNKPTLQITNRHTLADVIKTDRITLTIESVTGSGKPVTAVHVIVNGVPVYGRNGYIVTQPGAHITATLNIQLTPGANRLQVYTTDANNLTSVSENISVQADIIPAVKPVLYFVGIGINRFRNPQYNLNWSVKDIHDLAIGLKEHYPDMQVDTLFDENVTRQNVLAIKQRLLQLSENDRVIVSYSGHGLLNKNFDYYLSTYDINFETPETDGLLYESLEWLIDSIKPRNKLMLIDACHSGEVDKTELQAINTYVDSTQRGATVKYTYSPTVGMKNSFEFMGELFANVNRGTGATVIAASGGTQFAQENGVLKNGVFTYSILELMRNESSISVSQLRNTVGRRVVELTNGLQKPTSRNENIENDWPVW